MKRLVFSILIVLIAVVGCTLDISLSPDRSPVNNIPPDAYIDSISHHRTSTGENILFEGHGTDSDGTVVAYLWHSDLDGDLSTTASFETSSLSPGEHIIYLRVRDNSGDWSEDVSRHVIVGDDIEPPPPPAPGLPIIAYFRATPSEINIHETSVLSWMVTNATSVRLYLLGRMGETIDLRTVNSMGEESVSPNSTVTYVLEAFNDAGMTQADTVVTVNFPPLEVIGLQIKCSGPYSLSTTPYAPYWDVNILVNDDGVGTITYQWLRSDGAVSPTKSHDFYERHTATSLIDRYYWYVDSPGKFWVQCRTLTPNVLTSDRCYVTFLTGKVINVVALNSSPSGFYVCPYTISFNAGITTDGSGTVTYQWIQSNGAVSPTRSLTFSGAGSQMVTHTWTVTGSGSYWAQLRVLSPNPMEATQQNVTINCGQ